jgi:hypothetical protein
MTDIFLSYNREDQARETGCLGLLLRSLLPNKCSVFCPPAMFQEICSLGGF